MLLLLHQAQVVDWVEDGWLRVVIWAINLRDESHLRVVGHLGRLFEAALRVYIVPLLATLCEPGIPEIVVYGWLGTHSAFGSVFLVALLIYIWIEIGVVAGVIVVLSCNFWNVGWRVEKILLISDIFKIIVKVAFFGVVIWFTTSTSQVY